MAVTEMRVTARSTPAPISSRNDSALRFPRRAWQPGACTQRDRGKEDLSPGSILERPARTTFFDKLNYNFIRDMAPVAGIMRAPLVMVVIPSLPAKTVPEFIAYAKANPGKINMASPRQWNRRPSVR